MEILSDIMLRRCIEGFNNKEKLLFFVLKSGIFPVNMENTFFSLYSIKCPRTNKRRVKESNHSQGVITDDNDLQSRVEESGQSFEEDIFCLDMRLIAEDLMMGPKYEE